MLALACGISFLAGSIPTAFLFGKFLKGIDIRQFGSGNVGATNAARVLGKGAGVAVYAADFLKGFLPVILFSRMLEIAPSDFRAFSLIGFSSVLGHIFSPFLGFKGGKGVATGGGILAASFPWLFLGAILVWGATFKFTRIVSISSILAGVSLPLFNLFFDNPRSIHYSLVFIAALVFWSHRSNIRRLLHGDAG